MSEEEKEENYKKTKEVLEQLTEKCVERTPEGVEPCTCRHEQLLLKNMGAHKVILELLQVHYDKVRSHTAYIGRTHEQGEHISEI